jgi:hypothetical protein
MMRPGGDFHNAEAIPITVPRIGAGIRASCALKSGALKSGARAEASPDRASLGRDGACAPFRTCYRPKDRQPDPVSGSLGAEP